jgi:predicted RNA-binding Zn-ribbon protein involved in translation (DUF1610 family)
MAEYEIECNECGWRGPESALVKETDESRGETLRFCPDCGGTDFERVAEKD